MKQVDLKLEIVKVQSEDGSVFRFAVTAKVSADIGKAAAEAVYNALAEIVLRGET